MPEILPSFVKNNSKRAIYYRNVSASVFLPMMSDSGEQTRYNGEISWENATFDIIFILLALCHHDASEIKFNGFERNQRFKRQFRKDRSWNGRLGFISSRAEWKKYLGLCFFEIGLIYYPKLSDARRNEASLILWNNSPDARSYIALSLQVDSLYSLNGTLAN